MSLECEQDWSQRPNQAGDITGTETEREDGDRSKTTNVEQTRVDLLAGLHVPKQHVQTYCASSCRRLRGQDSQ